MTDNDNIVNLQRHRDGLLEAEVDAEVKSIMDDLMRRDVGLVKLMVIAASFHAQSLAAFASDEAALEVLIKDAQRDVRRGARYYFAKRSLGDAGGGGVD